MAEWYDLKKKTSTAKYENRIFSFPVNEVFNFKFIYFVSFIMVGSQLVYFQFSL